jgi:hypothetical protein
MAGYTATVKYADYSDMSHLDLVLLLRDLTKGVPNRR